MTHAPFSERDRISLCMIVRNEELKLARALESARAWVGEIVVVTSGIEEGSSGKVRCGDSEWLAKGPDAEPGTRMRVCGHEGTVLLVEQNAHMALTVAHFTQDAIYAKPINVIAYATYALVFRIPSLQKKLFLVVRVI